MNKIIGIKLADGSFYPILEEGHPGRKTLDLTTVKDNQTTVHVDLYRSEQKSMDDAEYVDTLQIENLFAHPNGEPDLSLDVILDDHNSLSAEIRDPESGNHSTMSVNLVNRSETERNSPANFELTPETDTSIHEDKEPSGSGLLAAADKIAAEKDSDSKKESPDIDINEIPEEFASPVQKSDADKSEPENDSFFDLPDFDTIDRTSTDSEAKKTESDVTSEKDTNLNEMDFTIPDFNDDKVPETKTDQQEGSGSSELDFSNLYDKETAAGTAAAAYNQNSAKKTKKHAVICIICAIICVIATVLILFVIPSPINLLKSRNTKNAANEPLVLRTPADQLPEVPEQPQPVTQQPPVEPPAPPAATENKIVISPEPAVIPAAPKKKKSENVSYKIRWGDTLWDISAAYYKNPWKYHRIAKYNHIKDPDYIISGTTITIPAQ